MVSESKPTSGSWMWRKLLKYREKAKGLHKIEVKSGKHTSFWHDTWCHLGKLYDILGVRGAIDLGVASRATVSEVLDNHRRRNHRVSILNQIEDQIDVVRLNRKEEDDRSLWKFREDGFKNNFSSKQTWNLIREHKPISDWHKAVWFSFSTPRHSFITWLAYHDRLATGEKLRNWDAAARVCCVFCGETVETRDHLFFSCPYSSQVWSSLTRGILQNRYAASWSVVSSLLLDTSQPKLHTFTLRYVFQLTIHTLWRERNGRHHGETPTPSTNLTKLIDKNVRNRFSSIQRSRTNAYVGGLQYWFCTRTRIV